MAESNWTLLANLEQDLHFSLLEFFIFSWTRNILSNQWNPTVLQRAQFLSMLCTRKGRFYVQLKPKSCCFRRAGGLHWSPSRKPWPQLCLPPPCWSSAALLMLAGGIPNPDTPPLLFGSQRYLRTSQKRRREFEKELYLGGKCQTTFPCDSFKLVDFAIKLAFTAALHRILSKSKPSAHWEIWILGNFHLWDMVRYNNPNTGRGGEKKKKTHIRESHCWK